MLPLQAPWEGTIGGQPRVRISPQEASRPYLPVVLQAEGWAEVRELASGSVGLAFWRGEPSMVAGGSEGPAHSPALNDRRRP